jgi:lipid A ethanolaminephosphotransferase
MPASRLQPALDPSQSGGASARRFEIDVPAEVVLLGASVFWALSANASFFRAALRDQVPVSAAGLATVLTLAVALVCLHLLLLALFTPRPLLKPLLAFLIVATAVASHFIQTYGVYLDPAMLRNVLHTYPAEAGELLTPTLALHLAVYAGLPLLVLWRVRVRPRPWRRSVPIRLGVIAGAALVGTGALLLVFQPFASLMRNHKEVRYLITPANLVYSTASALAGDARTAAKSRTPIGLDAKPGSAFANRSRPFVVVLVVGETARAANWGLSGYERQTTPELAKLPVVNFRQVTSCGTHTEGSLPCMFAPVGRRDYDEARIRSEESLLHLLSRAGVEVHWRDNQSGCKGVCDGLAGDRASALAPPGTCPGDQCLDEVMLKDLDSRLTQARGTQLWVMHQLGNHGPAYWRRYPREFNRFQPACQDDDLGKCSREEIVNAYDNALLYTDHVLARLIAGLQARAKEVDSVMLYVSDHGESLGENGLFLHGMPYAIAPAQQTEVPMVMWMSEGAAASTGVAASCLEAQAGEPASHDNLFHTLLGLLDVRTSLYESSLDIGAACHARPMAAASR